MDSNHRSHGRQIYSLFPLAARESPQNKNGAGSRNRTNNLLITNQLLCLIELYQHKIYFQWMVLRGGIEPPTRGFSVPCSTYWATEAKHWRPGRGSNPRPPAWQAGALTKLSYRAKFLFCKWWAFRDLNPGPIGYEPTALTDWAKGPSWCLVGVKRLELPTPWSQTTCATKLRYTPTCRILISINSLFRIRYFLTFVNNNLKLF